MHACARSLLAHSPLIRNSLTRRELDDTRWCGRSVAAFRVLRHRGVEVQVRPLAVLRRSLMSPRGISRVAAAWATDAGGLGRMARKRGVALVHTNTSVTLGGAAAARIAGIMGAKRTSDLIPLCHPLALTSVTVELEPERGDRVGVHIAATAETDDKTGVEMEALTAASVAALTIYDMCKAVDRGMEIEQVRLTLKEGGKSGTWIREEESHE